MREREALASLPLMSFINMSIIKGETLGQSGKHVESATVEGKGQHLKRWIIAAVSAIIVIAAIVIGVLSMNVPQGTHEERPVSQTSITTQEPSGSGSASSPSPTTSPSATGTPSGSAPTVKDVAPETPSSDDPVTDFGSAVVTTEK